MPVLWALPNRPPFGAWDGKVAKADNIALFKAVKDFEQGYVLVSLNVAL
ncbi:hypothetical protein X474_06830 [Dethiosulfatarculus sandiegensis]|uniref:Uncharacterized protein n=1 Tax=Dethiosulfatarculus sandiegensis TaxID=1429043 RepID=A0A0D2J9N3_9BACT|nr:hypothetical protein X474_06830 [Dethiosulfatarculus sandiegensis]